MLYKPPCFKVAFMEAVSFLGFSLYKSEDKNINQFSSSITRSL